MYKATQNQPSLENPFKLWDPKNMYPTLWTKRHDSTSHSLRVLLVDDDVCFGKTMRRTARKQGIAFTYCKNLSSFLKKLDDQFDIIMIDIHLDNVSGIELADYVRRGKHADLPIVFVSQSYASPDAFANMRQVHFMHKSLGPQVMLDTASRKFSAT